MGSTGSESHGVGGTDIKDEEDSDEEHLVVDEMPSNRATKRRIVENEPMYPVTNPGTSTNPAAPLKLKLSSLFFFYYFFMA